MPAMAPLQRLRRFSSGSATTPPPRSGPNGIPVPDVDPSILNNLRIPVLSVVGGEEDILYAPSKSDIPLYLRAPLFWASIAEDGHGGTFRRANGGTFANVALAWLDWQLKGNDNAARMFKGADFTLCTNSSWEVVKKNFE